MNVDIGAEAMLFPEKEYISEPVVGDHIHKAGIDFQVAGVAQDRPGPPRRVPVIVRLASAGRRSLGCIHL